MHFVRYPADISLTLQQFMQETRHLLDDIYNVITHLEWDRIRRTCGKPAAARFMSKCKLRSESFSRHNRAAVSGSIQKQKAEITRGEAERGDTVDTDDMDDADDEQDFPMKKVSPEKRLVRGLLREARPDIKVTNNKR
jgi:hypothetical protein